jgi:polygalacturonase
MTSKSTTVSALLLVLSACSHDLGGEMQEQAGSMPNEGALQAHKGINAELADPGTMPGHEAVREVDDDDHTDCEEPRFSDPERVKRPPSDAFEAKACAVKDYGAKGDGVADDTAAINMAIAACSVAGGTVTFDAGTYMTTSVHLMSNIKLDVDAGVTIKGMALGYDAAEPNPNDPTNKFEDFGHNHWHDALMWGENLTNVAIVGAGTIDGTALVSNTVNPGQADKQIALKSSQFIQFEGLHQTGGGHFFYLLTDCHDVTMSHLAIDNGRDGVDFVGNTNVTIHDVTMSNMNDDTIALKSDFSLGRVLKTDNVTVRDCTLQSGTPATGGANGLQFGSETVGDFENISFSNITITQAGKAGIGMQTNDGAVIRNVSYCGITMHTVADPIFINTTSRLRRPPTMPPTTPGHVENIFIRNVTATDIRATNRNVPEMANPATLSGEAGNPHRHIVLENVSITYNGDTGMPDGGATFPPYGGGSFASGNAMPADPPADYNPRVMGIRPAYGFYIRHVQDIVLHNVKVGFSAPDFRPAIVARDVDQFTLSRFSADRAPSGAWPSIRLDAMVTNFKIRHSTPQFPTVTVPDASMTSY